MRQYDISDAVFTPGPGRSYLYLAVSGAHGFQHALRDLYNAHALHGVRGQRDLMICGTCMSCIALLIWKYAIEASASIPNALQRLGKLEENAKFQSITQGPGLAENRPSVLKGDYQSSS